jgi:exodeoxyribonuclease-3
MEVFLPHLMELQAEGREVVICGDWNIAHKEIDLKNWKGTRRIPASCPRNAPG